MDLPPLSDEGKARIEKVLARAASDVVFREELLKDPRAALKQTDLTEPEISALETLNRVGMEELGVNIKAFRSFMRDNGNSAPVMRFAIEASRK